MRKERAQSRQRWASLLSSTRFVSHPRCEAALRATVPKAISMPVRMPSGALEHAPKLPRYRSEAASSAQMLLAYLIALPSGPCPPDHQRLAPGVCVPAWDDGRLEEAPPGLDSTVGCTVRRVSSLHAGPVPIPERWCLRAARRLCARAVWVARDFLQ